VFGGFSAGSVRERMEFSEAKALITVDGARRKGKTANIKQAVDDEMGDLRSLEHIVVVKRTGADCEMRDGRDVWYHEIVENAKDECPAEELDAEHPLYVLYTSGSTAKPKGVLHTTGGYLTGVASTHRYVFDLHPDEDVYWCSADVGWVTGHSYIVYGPMVNGATSADSTSIVLNRCPLTLSTSSTRPMIQKYPSLSLRAPSPVKYIPGICDQ